MINGNKAPPVVQLDLDQDHLFSLDKSLLNVDVPQKTWNFGTFIPNNHDPRPVVPKMEVLGWHHLDRLV